MENEIILHVPLALQNLIRANNSLLKNYQTQLMREIEEANTQMMSILKLNVDAGWVLDMERMVYTRPTEKITDEPLVG